jgi:alpha-D-ribose 1-methylphosphonate 5-triphosphate diphosphatase
MQTVQAYQKSPAKGRRTMNLLQVEKLNKQFTLHNLGGKNIKGFNTISFNLSRGEVLSLSGPSGVGKSSVLKCIYRTYLPSGGRILYTTEDGRQVDLATLVEHHIIRLRQKEIGYVSQFLNVLPRVTAVDVVAEPLLQRGVPIESARERAKSLLGQLNIPDRLHGAYPVTFSGGEQQRLNIARAVISKPQLLLLDEPTASLDVNSIQIVLNLMEDLRQEGTTIIMICHDKKVEKKMADTTIPMYADGTPIRSHPTPEELPLRKSLVIKGGNLVLRDNILKNTDIVVHDGRIAHIGGCPEGFEHLSVVDARNLWVMPGFIDLHSDAIEKSIQPRPRAVLPMEIALTELDKNLAASGITTMHHCLSFTGREDNELRYFKKSADLVNQIHALAPEMLVRTRIHARYEILEAEAISLLTDLMAENKLDLVSLMDHTPGQGQFRNPDYLYEYYSKMTHLSRQQIDELVERRISLRRQFDDGHVKELVQQCHAQSIPVASHDDDTAAKVEWVHGMGVQISEFPVTLEAAETARSLGMNVLMGAPNIIFGRSLSDNLSGRDAVSSRCCNLIGSDYSPSSLLHAVFTLHELGLGSLPELVGMISHQPAKVMGREDRIGSITQGMEADLVLVDAQGPAPRVIQTFVAGRRVFTCR